MGIFSFLSGLKTLGTTKTPTKRINPVPEPDLYKDRLLLDFIASYETFQPKAYLPTPNDVWTIGYGRTEGVKPGDVTTEPAEIEHLINRVSRLRRRILAALQTGSFVDIDHLNAMISLADNVGLGALLKSNSFAKYKSGDTQGFLRAFDPVKGFVRQKGKILRGLVRRRQDEKRIFEKGVYKRTYEDV